MKQAMRPYPLAVIAAMLAFLAVGCRHSESENLSATVGNVHLERLGEAERVLEQIDSREAWVFKHRGGLLTTEFTVFHRPQGKDQAERVIFQSSGDGVALSVQDREQHATAEDDGSYKDGGYVILVIPQLGWPPGADSLEITHSFSLVGVSRTNTKPANEVYPKTVGSSGPGASGGAYIRLPRKVKLSPGESATLVDLSRFLGPRDTDVPMAEWEEIRYVLTVTALQDGHPAYLRTSAAPAIPE
jgi:hypothetical protein